MIDFTLSAAASLFFAKGAAERQNTVVVAKPARVNPLVRFRNEQPALFEARRIAGMKKSDRVRENLQRIHRECKAQWKASALQNPKLRATDSHIAAKEWILVGPNGQQYQFRNLKKFVREHADLFDAEDVNWKEPEGKPNQAWCRAFQALSRLRPSCSKVLGEWNGWRWAGR